MKKILITPRSFAKHSDDPLHLLEASGFTPVRNPFGQILTREQMIEYIRDCEGVIIGIDPLDKEVLAAAGKLRAIAKYGVGTDNIDLDYARERGIPVSITAGANSDAVADFVFAMILTLARDLIVIDRNCRAGNWKKRTGLDVFGKTMGIVGLGAIGKKVAQRAIGFSMNLYACDQHWDEDFAQRNGIKRATVHEICRECDFISLHLPLTAQTRHLIGSEELAMMKNNAILINTARGGIVDEDALLDALSSGSIRGAGVDAFVNEPPNDPRWFRLDNVVLGNHAAASTVGAANAMSMMAACNLLDDLGRDEGSTPC